VGKPERQDLTEGARIQELGGLADLVSGISNPVKTIGSAFAAFLPHGWTVAAPS
jgi:hypothetical protein